MSTKYSFIGLALLVVGLAGGLFQACGETRAFFANRQAYTPLEKIQEDFMEEYDGLLTAASCQASANYKCEHEIFSASETRRDVASVFDCVNVGEVEICADGETRTYNSSMSTAEQEYEKHYCRYEFQDSDGVYPVQGQGDDHASAIQAAYDTCMRMAGG